MKTWFKSGSWNAVCDVCGFRFKADKLKRRWDNLMVCEQDYEMDHPQKYIRVRETGIAAPFIREDNSTLEYVCYIYGKQAYADVGEADCMQADTKTITYSQALSDKGSIPGGTFTT
jgi:hypothetical protein